jgi:small neutral amino acid transporter SnatA (MarC family)
MDLFWTFLPEPFTIVTRVMGLILAFLAVQYVIDGVHAVRGT